MTGSTLPPNTVRTRSLSAWFTSLPIRIKVTALFLLGLFTLTIAVASPIFFIANSLFARQAEAELNQQNEIVVNEIEGLSAGAAADLLLARQNAAFDQRFMMGDQASLDAIQKQLLFLNDRYAIDEICVIMSNGAEVARYTQGNLASPEELSLDETDAPFFAPTLALADGEVYQSPKPYLSADTNRWVVAYAAPIVLPDGTKAGIFHFEIPLVWFAAKVNTNGLDGGYSFLMTKDGQMLVHPDIDEMRKVTGIDPSNPEAAAFPPATAWGSEDFHRLIDRMKSEERGTGTYQDGSGMYHVVFRPAHNNNWIVVTVQQQSVIGRPSFDLLGRALTIIIPLLILIIGITLLMITWLVAPITRLTEATQRVIEGDLSVKVMAESSDEIGVLASAFNAITKRLQEVIDSLEQRMAERTMELNASNIQSKKRAEYLQIISDISRIISSEQRLDTLLPLITRLVSEKLNFYHAGIFLVDDNRLFAILQAANSEGGQRMLNRGHRLELGIGIVGTVALTGKPRIALDVGADAVFFDNPDLPATRSEMALPLKVRGETIGALDVQSTRAGEFTEDDANILAILADQIAIAIENARLFARTQQALEEVQALYNQYLQKEWGSLQSRIPNVGYWQTLSGGKPLEAPVESDDIRHALQTGQTLISKPNGTNAEPAVIVPIKLRGQTIGVLSIRAAVRDREWSRDELNLIHSVTDRLALALENARLFEDTSRRAERERLVTEITGKIRSENDPQAMIQTALEELRSALGASRVLVIPQTLPDSEKYNE